MTKEYVSRNIKDIIQKSSMKTISDKQRLLHERLSLTAKRVIKRMARGNINLILGRFVTDQEIQSRLHSAAACFKNAK